MKEKKAAAGSAKRKTKADNKTQATGKSVEAFLAEIDDEGRRQDALALVALMKKVTRAEPKMWGTAIVGFGDYQYESESGRYGDWFLAGFSPRKAALTIYLMGGVKKHMAMIQSLGKVKTSGGDRGGCLYIRRLEDVDEAKLSKLLAESVASLKARSARS